MRRAAETGDRSGRARLALAALGLLLVAALLGALDAGPVPVGWRALGSAGWAWLTGNAPPGPPSMAAIVLIDIRLPRVLMGVAVGALLAIGGAVLQGLFRNPLADPGIIGVSSGAALGAVVAIILGDGVLAPVLGPLGAYGLPLFAFAGALAATFLLYRFATVGGRTSVATMLLAGIALAALAGAVTGFLIFGSNDRQLRDITFWSLGSLGGATWPKVASVAPFLAALLVAVPFMARGLNAIVLGEAEARHLGIRVQALKRAGILLVAAATGAAVAVSGVIGFVGIVVPHLLRLAIGPDHRYLLAGAGFGGAILLLLADMASRTLVAPAELPIGIVTAALGGPFFLWILLRRRGMMDL
ncbi:MAG TPA: iron ABC transporter permease [Hyphomicrobiales bacterium]|nr:iron ABC transporter permease [Hyphomicrobiales bacterium]